MHPVPCVGRFLVEAFIINRIHYAKSMRFPAKLLVQSSNGTQASILAPDRRAGRLREH
jgi:hypothetical protein